MRILYVGRHGPHDNQDEDAVAHALRQLGHHVVCVQENDSKGFRSVPADFCLFNKWADFEGMRRVTVPKVFWYWDLVDYPDPTLAARCRARLAWMREVIPQILVGFCTDGDFVTKDATGKLVWLPQGADERVAGRGTPSTETDILFVGSAKGGQQRESFVESMFARWGNRFRHVPAGVHGRQLRDLIAGAKIVVAPDGPVTDRYFSNRLFLTLGFGGFLLHPWSDGAADCYAEGEEVVFYRDREELHWRIALYLESAPERKTVADAALERTLREHTYRHRCAELIRVVQERLQ